MCCTLRFQATEVISFAPGAAPLAGAPCVAEGVVWCGAMGYIPIPRGVRGLCTSCRHTRVVLASAPHSLAACAQCVLLCATACATAAAQSLPTRCARWLYTSCRLTRLQALHTRWLRATAAAQSLPYTRCVRARAHLERGVQGGRAGLGQVPDAQVAVRGAGGEQVRAEAVELEALDLRGIGASGGAGAGSRVIGTLHAQQLLSQHARKRPARPRLSVPHTRPPLTAPVCFCIRASMPGCPPRMAAASHRHTEPSARPPATRPSCGGGVVDGGCALCACACVCACACAWPSVHGVYGGWESESMRQHSALAHAPEAGSTHLGAACEAEALHAGSQAGMRRRAPQGSWGPPAALAPMRPCRTARAPARCPAGAAPCCPWRSQGRTAAGACGGEAG